MHMVLSLPIKASLGKYSPLCMSVKEERKEKGKEQDKDYIVDKSEVSSLWIQVSNEFFI